MSDSEILEEINKIEESAKALKHEILSLCWYMRGSITYDEAMILSLEERTIISDIVKGHLETTKKSGLPFF
jgi:hypothetical protein